MIKYSEKSFNILSRDSLTDMTLIMYACKAGASGVGSVDIACKITDYLIQLGADLEAK